VSVLRKLFRGQADDLRFSDSREKFGDPHLDEKAKTDVLPIESFTTHTFYNATGIKEDHNPYIFK
jgi:hypothetical protein